MESLFQRIINSQQQFRQAAHDVTVHTPGRSDGQGWPAKRDWTAAVTQANTSRPGWRQVSIAVNSVSTKGLPPVGLPGNQQDAVRAKHEKRLGGRPSGAGSRGPDRCVPHWDHSPDATGCVLPRPPVRLFPAAHRIRRRHRSGRKPSAPDFGTPDRVEAA